MSRTTLITPAFCKAALLDECLEHIYRDPPGVPHAILLNHYPIDKESNNESIRNLAKRYGCELIDSGRDLGLHESINRAARALDLGSGDIMVGCDPDDRPSPGFVKAIESTMRADPAIAVLALNFSVIDARHAEGKLNEETTAGNRVWIHPTVEMWTVAGFNWGFIQAIGGMKQPNAYYGGLESYMYPRWKIRNMRLGYLADVRADAAAPNRDDPKLFDTEYREWKTAHVAGYKGGFEEWLREFKPGRLTG